MTGPQPSDSPTGLLFSLSANGIERAIGWFSWGRALATPFDKLAVNDVALWNVANVQYLPWTCPEALGVQLSESI